MSANESARFMPTPHDQPQSGVYFVRSGDFLKVGRTTQLNTRLKILRQHVPIPQSIEFIGIIAIPAADLRHQESAIKHELTRQCAPKHQNEWFEATDELLGQVQAWLGGASVPSNPPLRQHEYYYQNRARVLAKSQEKRDAARAISGRRKWQRTKALEQMS